MGLSAWLRIRMVTQRRWIRLASIHQRTLGLDQLRMDLGFWIQLGLGAIPLRALGIYRRRLVLGPRHRLGSSLGIVAIGSRLCRMGAAAAFGRVAPGRWTRTLRGARDQRALVCIRSAAQPDRR